MRVSSGSYTYMKYRMKVQNRISKIKSKIGSIISKLEKIGNDNSLSSEEKRIRCESLNAKLSSLRDKLVEEEFKLKCPPAKKAMKKEIDKKDEKDEKDNGEVGDSNNCINFTLNSIGEVSTFGGEININTEA